MYGICSVNIFLAFSRNGNVAENSGYIVIESGYLKNSARYFILGRRTERVE